MDSGVRREVKFKWIQILRCIAAISVIAFHAAGTGRPYVGPGSGWLAPLNYGYAGVDLFFVVSGFIIYLTASRRETRPGIFLLRRLERVVPLYLGLTVLIAVMMLALPNLFHNPAPSIDRVVRSALFVSFTVPAPPVVYVGWSLEFEMLFYLAVCVGLASRRPFWDAIAIAFVAAVLAGLVVKPGHPVLVFLTSPLLLDFVLGTVIARTVLVGVPRLACAVVLFGIGAALLALADPTRVLFGVASGALVASAAMLDIGGHVPRSATFRFGVLLGNASYSLYLCQVLAIAALVRPVVRFLPWLPREGIAGLVAPVAIGAGLLLYLVVERPMIGFFHRAKRVPTIVAAEG